MEQVERLLYKSFHIDTNRINSRGSLVNMNILEKWHKDDVIALAVSEVAQAECVKSCDDKRSAKTFGYVYSQTLANTDKEKDLFEKNQKSYSRLVRKAEMRRTTWRSALMRGNIAPFS